MANNRPYTRMNAIQLAQDAFAEWEKACPKDRGEILWVRERLMLLTLTDAQLRAVEFMVNTILQSVSGDAGKVSGG